MISKEEIERLRELERRATPGEWISYAGVIQYIAPEDCTPERKAQRDVKKRHLAGVTGPDCKTAPESDTSKFISAIRNAAKELLDAAQENAKLREALRAIQHANGSPNDEDFITETARRALGIEGGG